jgi:hypothetical protein
MNTPPSDTKPTFTPEQKRTLGRLYSFLIELGQDRQRRMEKQINGEMAVNNKIPDLPLDQIERDMEPPG